MNTKYLMVSSSIFMGLLGLMALFLPNEILNSIGITSNVLSTLLLQITGALYLGFSLMNWMAKAALIGGIYSRPLCIGNFLHFMVAGLTLIKAIMNNSNVNYVLPGAVIYSIFSILFGLVLFRSPSKK